MKLHPCFRGGIADRDPGRVTGAQQAPNILITNLDQQQSTQIMDDPPEDPW